MHETLPLLVTGRAASTTTSSGHSGPCSTVHSNRRPAWGETAGNATKEFVHNHKRKKNNNVRNRGNIYI